MTRKPKVKTCADPGCPLTFTGRGLYCEGHQAGRDKPGSKLRKERKLAAQQRRRDDEWARRYAATGVKSPLHPDSASSQVRALQPTGHNGHHGQGVIPISLSEPGTGTATDAIDDFMAAWGCDMR